MNKNIYILGISAYYHDSAVALIKNGDIVFAAQEERFSRIKHDSRFPINALKAALTYSEIEPGEISAIVYFEDPKLKLNRIFNTFIDEFPKEIGQFLSAFQGTAVSKRKISKDIKEWTGYKGQIFFGNHHHSHAASAFFPSPFEEAAILTMDGTGEWATSTISKGEGNQIELLTETRFPHSLGLLYSSFTKYCGFKVNSGEYKLMGLAPYGEPKYLDLIKENLAFHDGRGSIRLNMDYFEFQLGKKMTNSRFEELFSRESATSEESTQPFFMDVAASIQKYTEEVVLGAAKFAKELTNSKKLCLAGGVALNCVANGKILEAGLFEEIWIQPAAGDAGGALGAALSYWYEELGNLRTIVGCDNDFQKGSYLGKSYSDEEIRSSLDDFGAEYTYFEDKTFLVKKVAELLSQENVIGWFQDRSEFGPRALGNRSILGDPRSNETQTKMNLKIKFRESFRPFAPAVLVDKVGDWFDVALTFESPYMLLVAKVAKPKLFNVADRNVSGLDKLKLRRSEIPAVTHIDDSARIQTVDIKFNKIFYDLISEFEGITGVPVLVNTSFNVRGEPIVESPKDAYTCFMRTNIDYLCLGNYLLFKGNQKIFKELTDWRNIFELD